MSLSDESFARLYTRIAVWANPTFGNEVERGPIGPLKHLVKEVWTELLGGSENMTLKEFLEFDFRECPELYDETEWADLLILWCDSQRRAAVGGGFSDDDADRREMLARALQMAHRKMDRNELREWPKPDLHHNRPIEHDRSFEHVCLRCKQKLIMRPATPQEAAKGVKAVIPDHERAVGVRCESSGLQKLT